MTPVGMIGLLGGMSWESTQDYYRVVNQVVAAELGGLHSARVLLHSVDFAEIERCQASGDWDRAGAILGDAARGLELAGADFVLICANTMHKVADQVQARVRIPLLHIADAVVAALQTAKISKVALLGTRYTMTQPFLKDRLAASGRQILVPDDAGVEIVNAVIYDELCRGVVRDQSRQAVLAVIDSLVSAGAQGVILGCTELPMLIRDGDCRVPLFDTTTLHATAAAKRAVSLATPISVAGPIVPSPA